jgi:hypothetical protein
MFLETNETAPLGFFDCLSANHELCSQIIGRISVERHSAREVSQMPRRRRWLLVFPENEGNDHSYRYAPFRNDERLPAVSRQWCSSWQRKIDTRPLWTNYRVNG